MANRTACEARLDELDFLNMEQALAYCHIGETRFREKILPEINTYYGGSFYKEELKQWMLRNKNVVVMRVRHDYNKG